MNSPNISVGNFFQDCFDEGVANISLVGTTANIKPFYDFFSIFPILRISLGENGFDV